MAYPSVMKALSHPSAQGGRANAAVAMTVRVDATAPADSGYLGFVAGAFDGDVGAVSDAKVGFATSFGASGLPASWESENFLNDIATSMN